MAGVVETTNTFATNDVITSTLLNNIIDQTLFTSDALSGGTLALTSGKMKVATSGITSNEMAVNAVTANAIAADAVTTVKILDGNVTTAKILDANVTTAKILDSNVTTAKIANANITAAKLDGAQPAGPPIYGARAWACFQSNGTIVSTGGNVGSITNPSTGQYSVTFTTAMPNVNYAILINAGGTIANEGVYYASVTSRTTSGFYFVVTRATNGTSSGDLVNMTTNGSLVVFG